MSNCKSDKSKIYIKSLKNTENYPAIMYHDSTPATSNLEKATLFNDFFESVFTQSSSSLPPLDKLETPANNISNIDISEDEVYKVLVSLNPDKAMGADGIGPRVLKYCALALHKPFHRLFTLCLSRHWLPQEWKIHRITPVFKSGDRALVRNYRPISLLSTASKVLERLVYNKISAFTHGLISMTQFGFLPKHSCLQQLLSFISEIIDCQERKSHLHVVYLDVRKAFDSVPHCELLLKLRKAGIVGDLWDFFHEYLTSRLQCVAINSATSSMARVKSGVPQGSILGPLLFILYINDIPEWVPMLKAFSFADDTKLITSNDDCHNLQGLDAMNQWRIENKLLFNESKCAVLCFPASSGNLAYTLNNCTLPIVESQRDLGVVISNNLCWTVQYQAIIFSS